MKTARIRIHLKCGQGFGSLMSEKRLNEFLKELESAKANGIKIEDTAGDLLIVRIDEIAAIDVKFEKVV
jgi:hypothetical protein